MKKTTFSSWSTRLLVMALSFTMFVSSTFSILATDDNSGGSNDDSKKTAEKTSSKTEEAVADNNCTALKKAKWVMLPYA